MKLSETKLYFVEFFYVYFVHLQLLTSLFLLGDIMGEKWKSRLASQRTVTSTTKQRQKHHHFLFNAASYDFAEKKKKSK